MTEATMTGLFFTLRRGDILLAGEVVRPAEPGYYLVRIDSDADTPCSPLELASIEQMADSCDECSDSLWSFFETRADLDAYLAWLAKPLPSDTKNVTPIRKDKRH